MKLSTKYNPQGIEDKWYEQWMANKLFASTPNDKPAYTIVIPPPNVTGILHMGHMLNNTIQDILVRRARMRGYNACWVPGTDHASIATESKVVNLLATQGKSKEEIGRDAFLGHAFEWKEKYGGIILEQLQKLGCSCDWDRTRFTMEEDLSKAVIKTFVKMHEDGYIYHGTRMTNWDPVGKTALSDEEVIHEEQQAQLYYIKYKLSDRDGFISVATTRPETIMGDTAICVHPDDERYKDLIGKTCIVPLINREVPIIADDYIDLEFGTGALKVTPAHDINDYHIGQRHGLETIDVFDEDANLSEAAQIYVGTDRFKARKLIANDLDEAGLLTKTETIANKVGKSERTKAVIEPRLSAQWFVDMKKFMADNPKVLDSVLGDEIQFHPAKFKNTYRHWLENIKDWCISRQLWWGHRIPAFYTPDGQTIIAHTAQEAWEKCDNPSFKVEDIKQDEDVLDTWFSSWLWPISVFNGLEPEGKAELSYYYPTADLVTAPDIIFFWVARMIMAGYSITDSKPFSNVYFTGIVRDKQRRKMSKSLGNSPDALGLMKQYGTDGVRMGLMLSAPAGNDLLFDESLCEQGRNFCNKLWNAFRLIQSWEVTETQSDFYQSAAADAHQWMGSQIAKVVDQIDNHFESFRISDALMELYKLTRDDFSGWYLEMLKPPFGDPIPESDLDQIKHHFDHILRLLHPFMPFITEELWQTLNEEKGSFINLQDWPKLKSEESTISERVFKLISAIRALRNENGISPKVEATVFIRKESVDTYQKCKPIIDKLANVEAYVHEKQEGFDVLIDTDEITISFKDFVKKVDVAAIEGEIKRLQGFLIGIEKKLGNEKFVANAKPEIVAKENQKKEDTLSKIESLKKQITS